MRTFCVNVKYRLNTHHCHLHLSLRAEVIYPAMVTKRGQDKYTAYSAATIPMNMCIPVVGPWRKVDPVNRFLNR